jgi:hypothetical protein
MRTIAAAFVVLAAALAGCASFPYPDRTDFGFNIYDDKIESDLNLRRIDCDRQEDGTLLVVATVRNQGSSLVPSVPLPTGTKDAFRVVATTTSANGTQEQLEGIARSLMLVTDAVNVEIKGGHTPVEQITRISVVADPDYWIPDPFRENNVLAWQGTLSGDHPQCLVSR